MLRGHKIELNVVPVAKKVLAIEKYLWFLRILPATFGKVLENHTMYSNIYVHLHKRYIPQNESAFCFSRVRIMFLINGCRNATNSGLLCLSFIENLYSIESAPCYLKISI